MMLAKHWSNFRLQRTAAKQPFQLVAAAAEPRRSTSGQRRLLALGQTGQNDRQWRLRHEARYAA